jgi:hypothetical protein
MFIPVIQESLLLDEKVVDCQQQNVENMDSLKKTESLRKERVAAHLNLGDVMVSDKKGDTLAINDYLIEIQTDGGFMVKMSASYDLGKIKKEGFDSTTIQAEFDAPTLNQLNKNNHTSSFG